MNRHISDGATSIPQCHLSTMKPILIWPGRQASVLGALCYVCVPNIDKLTS